MKSPNLGEVIVPNWSRLLLRTLFENNPPKVSLYIFANFFHFWAKVKIFEIKNFCGKNQMRHFFGIFQILCFFFFVVQVQRRGLLWPVEKKNHRWKGLWAAKWHFFCSAPYPSFLACLISWAEGEKLVPLLVLSSFSINVPFIKLWF